MAESESNHKKSKSVLSEFTIDQFVTAVVSLGKSVKKLRKSTWRVNNSTKGTASPWSNVINKLNLDDNEKVRHCLYNLLHRKHDELKDRINEALKKEGISISESGSNDTEESEDLSIEDHDNVHLQPEVSVPLPERPNTRTNENQQVNNNENDNHSSQPYEMSFVLTPQEWHNAYSFTNKQMKKEWTNIFVRKLKNECGVTCAIRVRNKHFRTGERKLSSSYFCFKALCTNKDCKRIYTVKLQEEVGFNASPMFRVQISGEINHDRDDQIMARQLTGEERRRVGKHVSMYIYI